MDYRNALRAKGFKPLTAANRAKLRTRRQEGDVEVLPAGLIRHDGTGRAVPA